MEVVGNYIKKKVDEQMNEELCKDMIREEIKMVAFQLGASKAPGPYG